jgi:DNA polymerase III delta subunit
MRKKSAPSCVLVLVARSLSEAKKPRRGKKTADGGDLVAHLTTDQNRWGKASAVEFATPGGTALIRWISDEFRRYDKSVSDDVCALFADMKGTALRDIANEIGKLHIAYPDRGTIGKEEILEGTTASRVHVAWELAESVLSMDQTRSLDLLLPMLHSDSSAGPMLLATLAGRMRILWHASSFGDRQVTDREMSALGLRNSWQYGKMRTHAKRPRSRGYFERCFTALAEADNALKSSGPDPLTVLVTLICHLTRP